MRGHRSLVLNLLGFVGTMLAVAGVALGLYEGFERYAYHRLRTTQGPHRSAQAHHGQGNASQEGHAGGGTPDWSALEAINPAVCGWVRVEGTDIDLPVVHQPSDERDYYLHHDLWKRPSVTGVPFLDHRTANDGHHLLVYGHHLASGGQFSSLQHAYEPADFQKLERCTWHSPSEDMRVFTPLCALRVHQSFRPIQHFSFATTNELRTWLADLVVQSDAAALEAPSLLSNATSVLTLVTCASDLSGQPWRTLTVFVIAGEAQ